MPYRKTGSRRKELSGLLSTLSIRKVWNLLTLLAGYFLSRMTGKAIHFGMPFSISIEPTTSCNLRCPECPSGLRSFTRPTGMLEPETFKSIIRQLKPWLGNLSFYFQGEPFLNPAFLDLAEISVKNGILTSTSTNAHYLNYETALRTVQSGLQRIIISIDGASQETYQQYRVGGRLDKVLEGTRNLVRARTELKSATPYIIFQFLVVKPNEHDIPEIERLAAETGVDEVKIKTAQIYDFEDGSDLIPDQEQYSRYKKGSDGKYRIKNELLNQCWKMWHSAVVTWDGKVLPCCFDKDAHHQLGSLKEKKFKEIWKGGEYQRFRNAILRSRSEIDICTNCTEGTKVWA
jgi:radical SAM protein with 4Fe4S-binding SPASM domain